MATSTDVVTDIADEFAEIERLRTKHKTEIDERTASIASKILAVREDRESPVTLTEIARAMGVHKTYVSHLVKVAREARNG